jgi:hypothetical protein
VCLLIDKEFIVMIDTTTGILETKDLDLISS